MDREIIGKMKMADLLKLLTGRVEREQVEIEITVRVNNPEVSALNELSLGDWDDCQ
jgi:hypothetical protein